MAKFEKGKSGNPGGRPKESPEVKELARQFTLEAVERLAFWMRSDNAKASVSASAALLDRGYGKPAQELRVPEGSITVEIRRFAAVPEKVTNSDLWEKRYAPVKTH
jgi:hypothetical protein